MRVVTKRLAGVTAIRLRLAFQSSYRSAAYDCAGSKLEQRLGWQNLASTLIVCSPCLPSLMRGHLASLPIGFSLMTSYCPVGRRTQMRRLTRFLGTTFLKARCLPARSQELVPDIVRLSKTKLCDSLTRPRTRFSWNKKNGTTSLCTSRDSALRCQPKSNSQRSEPSLD